MSQPPPIPPSQPPSQPPYPPQYPQMPPGSTVQYGGHGVMNTAPKVSGLAITSLVCSLILCLPFVSSLLGIIFGIAGIAVTGSGKRRGRVIAIIGIIVSLLSFVGWSVLSYSAWNGYGAPMMAGMSFVERAQAGDTAGARRFATADVSDADIQAISSSLAPLGKFRGGRPTGQGNQQFFYTSSQISAKITGQFDNGLADIDVALVRGADGWKVSKFKIIPVAASTQPAGVIDFSDMATDKATTVPAAP